MDRQASSTHSAPPFKPKRFAESEIVLIQYGNVGSGTQAHYSGSRELLYQDVSCYETGLEDHY